MGVFIYNVITMLIFLDSKKTTRVTIWGLVSVGSFTYNVITMLMELKQRS